VTARAFTLPELLIAVAIIGVTLAVGLPFLFEWRARESVRQTATQFAVAVAQARADAKRLGTCVRVEATGGAYAQRFYPSVTCAGAPTRIRTFTPAPGTTVTTDPAFPNARTGVTFRAPFGTTDAVPRQFVVASTRYARVRQVVRVTGVFGRAVLK